ncbi:MAG: Asp23/Gls24 family envelope stress response protein [Oscillospiraceae bacterium]|jgi:uncharacterized alkaline shock family protein YloU|nr:Asp23/Gls24 family envelope stress response protein [Oscillospiraceae bacterium]
MACSLSVFLGPLAVFGSEGGFLVIISENELGRVEVSDGFFVDVIKSVIGESFGVVRAVSNIGQKVRSFIRQRIDHSGILIERSENDLFIELHVEVKYGVNITATVKNLTDKIRYTIKNYDTGVNVRNVNVYVDRMSSS